MMRFCIILGAMKAGTTSLFNYLAQHPEIAPCKEKEPSFFSHHYKKGLNWYLSLWKGENTENKILLEASTNYTKFPSFPKSSGNIADFSNKHDVSIKFIYVMRNPIKRIESQYTYAYARWTDQPLEDRIHPDGHLVNVSRYAQQLDRYYDNFEPGCFLLLDFDDLANDPRTLLCEICQFIGVDADFQFSNIGDVHNKSKGSIITRPVERLYKKYPLLESFSNLFPKSFKRFLSTILLRQRIAGKFKLTDIQKQRVNEALNDDMARLQKQYGIDVKKWGF